jgi:hypothetical protein
MNLRLIIPVVIAFFLPVLAAAQSLTLTVVSPSEIAEPLSFSYAQPNDWGTPDFAFGGYIQGVVVGKKWTS